MYMWVKFTFPYYVEAMHERLSLSCVAKNASVEINLEKVRNWLTSSTFLSQLTSQHPYMETFIKKPHVYTIDINDLGLVEASIKEIVSRKVKYETSYH